MSGPPGLSVRLYAPTLLFSCGQGAIAPIVALTTRELGGSVVQASAMVALLGIGQLLGDLPAGAVAARLGERAAMLLASLVTVAALVACVLAESVWVFGPAIACIGFASSVWGLARQAYITEVMPLEVRARALSTLAGARRFGFFAGPFLGAAVMQTMGTDGAYVIHVVAAVAAAGVLAVLPDPSRVARTEPGGSTLGVVRDHARVLRTLGLAAVLVGAVRASRQAVLPLWADSIGLDAATTSLVFGLAGLADLLLFYPSGRVMDRHGRWWIGVPSMLVLGASHVALPLVTGVGGLAAVALVMGIGNGMSSGLLMVLGADASPAVGRAQFLGAWRLCSDAGNGLGPLALAAVAAASSLTPAVVVMGVVGLAAAAALHRWTPPTASPRVAPR